MLSSRVKAAVSFWGLLRHEHVSNAVGWQALCLLVACQLEGDCLQLILRFGVLDGQMMSDHRPPKFEKLPALKEILRKLDQDTEKTPAMSELRKILVKSIAELEEIKRRS